MNNAQVHNEAVAIVMSVMDDCMERGLPFDVWDSEIIRRLRERFGGEQRINLFAAMQDAMDRLKEQFQEERARIADDRLLRRNVIALLRRFPTGRTVGEAVRLGVEAGDHFALWVQDHPEVLEREIPCGDDGTADH